MVRAATTAHDLFLRRRLVMEARVLKLSDEQSAAVATSYDLAMLCTATQTILTQKLPDQKSRIKALFEACRSLNVTRVRVPHGTWIDDGTTLAARHISRNALSTKHYFAHTDEPRKLTEKARCPMTDLRHDAAPRVLLMATPVPRRHWRSYGDHPLPTGEQALDEPLRAFPSWFLRIACDRCGKEQLISEIYLIHGNMLIRDILDRMRHSCGGLAGKAELLTGLEGASSSPVRRIVLQQGLA